MKNKQIFCESTPPRHKGLFARFFALFFCLVMGMNVWGEVSYYTPTETSEYFYFVASSSALTDHAAIANASGTYTINTSDRTCSNPADLTKTEKKSLSLNLKDGNDAKTAVINIAGCSAVTICHTSNSGRKIKAVLTPSSGEASTQYGSVSSTKTTFDLDGTKSYSILFTAVDNANPASGADLFTTAIVLTKAAGLDPVSVTGVSLNKTTTSIQAGQTETLTATVAPANATVKTVTWTSDNETVATVANGVVTAKVEGTANITVTTTDGGFSASCAVTVTPAPAAPDFVFTKTGKPTSGNLAAGDEIAVTGGTMKVYSTKTETSLKWASDGLNFSGGQADQVIIETDKVFQVGSVISLTFKNNSLDILNESGTLVKTQAAPGTTYTVVADDGLAGNNVFRLRRNGSSYLQSIEITGLGSAVATWNVTFDMQGATSAAIATQSVVDGKKAIKPSDPKKTGFNFVKWVVASTEADYDFNAAVTADVALKAVWEEKGQLYTVTYLPGAEGVTGDMPTQEDVEEGATFTTAALNLIAREGYTQTSWSDGTKTYVGGAEYTMPAANVELTAIWKQTVIVTLDKNGATADGSAIAVVGSGALLNAVTHAIAPAGWTLQGYYTAAEGGELVITADGKLAQAAVEGWLNYSTKSNWIRTEAGTLYAHWTINYASSIDIEKYVVDNESATLDDAKAQLDAAHISYTNIAGVDRGHTHNYIYDGIKWNKDNNGDLSFIVEAGKLVVVRMGYLKSNTAAKMYVNGEADATVIASADENVEKFHNYYWYNDAVASYQLKINSKDANGTCVAKAVFIEDPYTVTFTVPAGAEEVAPMTFKAVALTLPAAVKGTDEFLGWFDAAEGGNKIGEAGEAYSPAGDVELFAQFSTCNTNNEITSFTYGETTVTATEGKRDYAVELPYKSTIPTELTYVSEAATKGEVTKTDNVFTFTVTSECGEAADYTITFTVAPKDGICIIEAALTSSSAATVTGAIGGTATVNVSSSYKMDKGKYVGVALANDANFQAGDVVVINVTDKQSATGFTLYTEKEGTNLIIDTRDGNVIANGEYRIVLPEEYAGSNAIYAVRLNNNETGNLNACVNNMKVLRVMNPVLKALTVAGVDATIDEAAKTISVKLPNGTVAADAVLVPTIVANGGEPTAALADVLAYNTPVNYVVTDKDGDQTTYVLTATQAAAPAATPTITTQPAGHDYLDTEVIAALIVVASTSDAGVLSYQWYKGEDAIAEATAATYTPTEAGSYKVVVTNTLGTETATATSEVAVITISHIYTFAAWDGTSVNFTKTGEWTMYSSYNGGKELAENQTTPATTFKANERVDDANVNKANVNYTNYVTVVFAKEMKAVQLLAYNSSSRTLNNIYTLDVEGKKLTDVTSKYTKNSAQNSTTKVSTMDATGHFEAGVYYVFKLSSSCNVFDFFATESAKVSEFAGLTAGKIGDADMTAAQLATLNSGDHTLTLEAAAIAPAVTFTYMETETYDDEYVKTIVNSTETADEATVAGNFVMSKTIAGTEYKVVVPVDVTPALSLDVTAGTAAIAGKTGRSKEFTVNLTGANLTNGEYSVTVPAVDGLTVAPATFTVADNAVNETFTITYASDADVAVAVANIKFTVGATTATFALTYSSVAWTEQEALVDVEGDITWDFSKITNTGSYGLVAGDYTIYANTGISTVNGFDATKLAGKGQYAYRDNNKFFQGTDLKFHTTVPGKVMVYYRSISSGKNMSVTINGKNAGSNSTGNFVESQERITLAGDVIVAFSGETYARVNKIVFTALTDADYTTIRTTTPGKIITMCQSKSIEVLDGAVAYEVLNKNAIGIDLQEAELPLVAGKPYILEASKSEIRVVYTGEDAIEVVPANGLIGNLSNAGGNIDITDYSAETPNYVVQNNHLCRANSNYLLPDRAYLDYSAIGVVAPAPGRHRISMGGAEAEVTTGMEAIESVEAQKVLMDGVLYIIRAGKTYTPAGQLVK